MGYLHIGGSAVRTNIDIDDKLMKQAMKATGARTKKAAVEASLRKLLEVKARERALERAMRLQEDERQAADRKGRLREWHRQVVKAGTRIEDSVHANQY
ncbi:MAG: type II toxin-antitoxin system VapB family antitoxin [Terracidiphilus sp.]